jgi:hypothetical protein
MASQPIVAGALHVEELARAHALLIEELATAHALQTVTAQPSFPTCTAEAPPPLGFPHTMLNVERVKDNM